MDSFGTWKVPNNFFFSFAYLQMQFPCGYISNFSINLPTVTSLHAPVRTFLHACVCLCACLWACAHSQRVQLSPPSIIVPTLTLTHIDAATKKNRLLCDLFAFELFPNRLVELYLGIGIWQIHLITDILLEQALERCSLCSSASLYNDD